MSRYTAILDGRERLLEITPLGEGRFRVAIDGAGHDIEVLHSASDNLTLRVDRGSFDLAYAFQGERLELLCRNHEFRLEVLDERRLRAKRAGRRSGSDGPEIVTSAMPGKIVEVHVAPGDTIGPHAPLLIMEAMKMENEIFSRGGGIVRSVHVRAGQAVEGGALLIEIGPPSAG